MNCRTCNEPTQGAVTCDVCWGVESRLRYYLAQGGEGAREFVLNALGALPHEVITVVNKNGEEHQ